MDDMIEEVETVEESAPFIVPGLSVFDERSTEIDEIVTALSAAQGEFLVAQMKGINAFHKSPYEDLTELYRVTRPALSKHGLSTRFSPCSYQDVPDFLHFYIYHNSGQFLASHLRLTPPRNTLEAIKSYVDAMMRLMYKSCLCIAAANDDDDGEGAMWTEREVVAKGTALNRNMTIKDESSETISSLEIRELEKALSGDTDLAEQLLDTYRIRSIADIPKSMFHEILAQTLKIKDRRSRAK
jgi:hypothetical protein